MVGYHMGKTMVQIAAEPGRGNPAYLLNSSLPQRPLIIGQIAKPPSYGGRPLGPHSYDIPSLPWMDEPERPTASFASKTVLAPMKPPITADIDYLNKPELIDVQRQVPPGFYSYTWGKQEQRPTDPSDAKLDKFYDYDNKLVPAACARPYPPLPSRLCDVAHSRTARTLPPPHARLSSPLLLPGAERLLLAGAQTQLNLHTVMLHHPRKYAASFQSQDRRFKPPKEARRATPRHATRRAAPRRTAPHRAARAAPHLAASSRATVTAADPWSGARLVRPASGQHTTQGRQPTHLPV